MDILLHTGAHRTGTTSFQHYLRANRDALLADGTALWEPETLRPNMFSGLFQKERMQNGRNLQRRAMGRVKMHATQARRAGAERLVISEENMIGAPRACLRAGVMYPGVGERLARLGTAFEGRIARVVLTIRSQELWWGSVMSYAIGRGHPVPPPERRAQIAAHPRTWRDVITDMACALPGAELIVVPFERVAGQADVLYTALTDRAAPGIGAGVWLNRAPDLARLHREMDEAGLPREALGATHDGRWTPFTPAEAAMLREAYADDMMWLTAGADGLATLTEETTRDRAGPSLPGEVLTKGHEHERRPKADMARSG
ncbi:hypothetical protein KDD17_03260 [Sulfitobacter albidus]|uniref:Sulfotransferase n=1 Tax=Sulfitobacter albidus TaxID=2829501 RepID=A0A975JF15_9RHOB|nr:hypothetical protein [Sulfitobacter albidus]QUJ77065.1 hypothetical protein KDD17_03260 [Sulfitobacter albidus]